MARSAPIDWAGLSINPGVWRWVPGALRVDLPWLAGMSWTRVMWLFAVTLGFAAWSLSGQVIRAGGWPWADDRDFIRDSLFWFVRYLVCLAPILLSLTIADNVPVAGTRRVAVLAIALVFGAQLQWPILCICDTTSEDACRNFPSSLWRSWLQILPETTLWSIAWSMPIAMVYFYRRHDQDIAKSLHDSEVARMDLQRRTLEADLQTMQARVEPSFLFDALGDIGDLQDRDPAAGERMLDELIRYLRAALPDTSSARSTLRQELALVRAYMAIRSIRMQDRLAFEVEIPTELEDTPIPAMVILPLLAAAIGEPVAGDGVTTLRMHVIKDAGRVRAVITGKGPAVRAVAATSAVFDIHERLRALYGERPVLHVDANAGRQLTAVLDLIDIRA
jgi:hypothetical protein